MKTPRELKIHTMFKASVEAPRKIFENELQLSVHMVRCKENLKKNNKKVLH